MRKIPTRPRGTNFCTSSARFALSFVRQPNGPKYTHSMKRTIIFSLESNGVDRVRSLRKIPTRLRGTNFCTSSVRFAPNSVRQPNSLKCAQIIRNVPKHQLRVQWGGSGAFVAKNSDVTSWHELLHKFGPFCSDFYKATKRSKMHPNSTKRQFRVQWGGSGAFLVKNSDATSCHELLH